MLGKKYLCEMVRQAPIWCEVTFLDDGIQVLLAGGDSAHVGSVTIANPDGMAQTVFLPNHKDQIIGEKWAKALAAKYRRNTAVTCGIHYDNATADEISEIIQTTDKMLLELLKKAE